MDQHLVTRIVEAALLAANQPLTVVQLNDLFSSGGLPLDEPAPEGSVEAALQALQSACTERGVELVELASGWRFQVQADVHPWVARLWTERQTRYTRATLETLALIAYRQPITRGEIEQVRGVSVNSNIIKALEEREWIRVVGHRDVPGRPALFGTTRGFLNYFGLKRLDELPPLSELKDIGELEPQFQFDGPAPAKSIAAGGIADGMETAGNDDSQPATGEAADAPADTPEATDSSTPAPSADAGHDPDTAPGERAADASESDDARSDQDLEPATDTHADAHSDQEADEQNPNDIDDTEMASSEQQK